MGAEVMSQQAYRALLDAAAARYPKACPVCGSERIAPTWLEDHEWDCANPACGAIWRVNQ